jgi:hypothetical protein
MNARSHVALHTTLPAILFPDSISGGRVNERICSIDSNLPFLAQCIWGCLARICSAYRNDGTLDWLISQSQIVIYNFALMIKALGDRQMRPLLTFRQGGQCASWVSVTVFILFHKLCVTVHYAGRAEMAFYLASPFPRSPDSRPSRLTLPHDYNIYCHCSSLS